MITELRGNTTYQITVAAFNSAGAGAVASTRGRTRISVPTAPTSVSVTPGDEILEVSWDEPADTSGVEISTYTVYWRATTESAIESTEELSGGSREHTIEGLMNGQGYWVEVSARSNVAGETIRSAAILSTPRRVPDQVVNVIATAAADRMIGVMWDIPDNGGAAITTFRVYALAPINGATTRTTDVIYKSDEATTRTSTVIGGLLGNTLYRVAVSAVNVAGEGDRSAVSTARTPVSAPGAPRVSVEPDDEILEVSWVEPDDRSGLEISTYTVYWRATAGNASTSTALSGDLREYTIKGLTNGQGYWVEVSATNNINEEGIRSAAMLGTPRTVPDPVIIANATASTRTIEVVWNVPLNGGAVITTFNVYWGVNNVNESSVRVSHSGTGTTASHTIKNLDGNTLYQIVVSAVNIAGEGVLSEISTVRTSASVPGAPVVQQVEAGNETLQVSWNEPDDTGDLSISTYTVYWRTTTESVSESESTKLSSNSKEYTIKELTNGQGYWVEVSATSEAGEGVRSAARLGTPRTVPGQVENVIVTASDRMIGVMWNIPDNGGAAITTFRVYALALINGATTQITDVIYKSDEARTRTSTTISSLLGNTLYRVVVSAFNKAGEGPQSSVSSVSSARTPISGARAPSIVRLDSSVERTLTVQWTEPTDNGGASITSYAVSWMSVGSDVVDKGSTSTIAGVTESMITELRGNTTYQITVAAFNEADIPGEVSTTMGRTLVSDPTAPTSVKITPQNKALRVEWGVPNDTSGVEISAYTVYWRATTESASEQSTELRGSSMTYTIEGLINGEGYWVEVSATSNTARKGVRSAAILSTPRTVPNPVIITSATAASTLAINAVWDVPFNGGAVITTFNIYWSADGLEDSSERVSYSGTGTTVSHTIAVIGVNTLYQIAVSAVNVEGEGNRSEISIVRTLANVPGAPVIIGDIEAGDHALTVKWDGPVGTGGAVITSYAVSWMSIGSDVVDKGSDSTIAGVTTYRITKLRGDTIYEISIVAFNSVGAGEAVSERGRTLPSVPTAPTSVSVTPGNTTLAVSWDEPDDTSNVEISAYTVYWLAATESASEQSTEVSGSSMMYTITGLTNGVGYWVAVSATNTIAGEVIRSAAILSTPRSNVPDQVVIANTTASMRAIEAVWDVPFNGGAVITTFNVYWGVNNVNESSRRVSHSGAGTTASYTIGDLGGNTTYQIAVAAVNIAGEGARSEVSTARTPISVARAPVIDELDSSVDHALTVRWSKPTDNGGAAITSYAVSWSGPEIDDTRTVTTTIYTVSGLRGNTTYRISVVAFNSAGAGAEASTRGRTRISVPTAPTSVSVTPGNDGSLQVSWGEPDDTSGLSINTYTVYWLATTENASEQSTEVSGSSMVYTIEGLANGVGYWVAVSARSSAAGEAIRSAAILSTPRKAPDQVENVSATGLDRALEVVWDVPGNGGAVITTFNVYWGVDEVDESSRRVSYSGTGTTANYTIVALGGNTTYQIVVAAVNVVGEGARSEVSTARTPISVARAPVIDGVAAGDHALIVRWSEPRDTGGATITSYAVSWMSVGSDMPDEGSDSTIAGVTTYTITELRGNEVYEIRVVAFNSAGAGEAASTRGRTLESVPTAPTSVSVTPGDKTLAVSWGEPDDTSGLSVSTYTVYWRATTESVSESTELSGNSRKHTIRGLMNGVGYWVEVSARSNVAGEVIRSAAILSTPRTVPGQVIIANATASTRAIAVVWAVPLMNGGAVITTFNVYWGVNRVDESSKRVSHSGTGITASYTIINLRGNTTYQIAVSAVNIAGEGARSEVSTARTPVSAPGAPRVSVEAGDKILEVSWDEPADTSGIEISTYTVYWRATSESKSSEIKIELSSSSTMQTIEGLMNGMGYWVEVSATNNIDGEGIRSAAILSTPHTVPDQVEDVIVTAADRMITVIWNIPNNGGAAITTFRVYAFNGATTQITDVIYKSDEATTTSTTISSLLGDTLYQVAVSAFNEAGEGPQSSTSSVSSARTPISVARAPSIDEVDSSVDHALTVRWSEPTDTGGAAITSYAVSWMSVGPDMSDEDSNSTIAGVTTYTISGLRGNTTYRISVVAFNSEGAGAEAGTQGRTRISMPTVPTSVSVTPGNDGSLQVSWGEPADRSNVEINTYTVYWRATTESTSESTEVSGSSMVYTIEELMNGVGYWVEVSATNNAGKGNRSAAILSTPRTVPGQVANVSATGLDRALEVMWDISSSGGAVITTFNVYWGVDEVDESSRSVSHSGTGTTASYTIVDLGGNTTYQIVVAAVNVVGEGTRSEVSTARTPISVARAPVIDGVAAGGHVLTVRWSEPRDTGGAAIMSYAVSWSGPGSTDTRTATTTTYTISGLRGNEVYEIRVVAFNSAGAGAAASTQGRTLESVPTAPTSVSVTPGDEILAVSWDEPADRSGVEISTYTVYWLATTENANEQSTEVSGSSMAYTIEGLTNGEGYWVAVSARSNVAGEAIRSAAILSTPRTVPGLVIIANATASTRAIAVVWAVPLMNGGAVITTFNVYWGVDEVDESSRRVSHSGTGTRASYTIINLRGNTTYQIAVSAVNIAGEGATV